MQTLEDSLASLISSDVITYEDALEVSVHPKELDRALNRQMQLLAERRAVVGQVGPSAGDTTSSAAGHSTVASRSG